MKESDKVFLGCLGLIFYAASLFAISALMNGWALVKLWEWFIIPVFESAPSFSMVQAIGISMVVSFLTKANVTSSDNKDEGLSEKIITAYVTVIFTPVLAVFFGYIITLFM